ncbi:hypothetical protein GBK02_09195 [Dechloromonas sp. TW-R-39-2]|uniref:host specificity factor TipJ family phage tail protein n=1 Tax=Dechloromonas sp. TW-R-39-2 TaxID=2654218 RepID=UPI00193E0B56|nr:host specificity factor TipJ family phage tail protein [Dechloromonas sp. TW-R-39-2]QRM19565.1 hypothetical protein GBK02_09195 [Dechloromonas sp. TW-R-39-2]
MPTLIKEINPFDPLERSVEHIPKNRKISALCPKSDFPVICIYNGKPLLRKGWGRRVKHGDVIVFIARPRGGGGIQKWLIVIVAAIYGIYTGDYTWLITTLVGAAISAMTPTPKMPSMVQQSMDMAAASPTYTIGAQGNAARLEQPIPVHYGRHIAFPDYGATPYQEYSDNDQYLYQLFVVGQGAYEVEEIRIEDTPIQNFDGVTTEIVGPGQVVTLFPSAVVQSDAVTGVELVTASAAGPFIVGAAGEVANYIGLDLGCPSGLYYANDQGGLDGSSVTVRFEAQAVDDMGDPVGGWIVLGTETISGATNTAIRKSYRYAVAPARYQIRAIRTNAKDTRSRAANAVYWGGLRAYLPEESDAGGVTRLAVRIKATDQLSQQASRKINLTATRMLPTWHPSTGWSAPVATRSIAWAIADICRASYGANMADDRYDLAGLYALNAVWTARGDTFDARLDSKMTVGEGLTVACRSGRAKWYQQAGQVRFWRDQPQTLPTAIFQPRNIKPGSFSMSYVPAVTDTSDAIRATYFDERYWKQRDVVCAAAGSAAAKLQDINMFGMVQRRQVIDEGTHIANEGRYRRRIGKFETEAEGYLPRYGDLIGICHDVPSWGQSGDVIGWDAATLTATLSEPPRWTSGQNHYIRLVQKNGAPTVPFQVSQHSDSHRVILAVNPGFVPETAGIKRERTRYTFGPANQMEKPALVRRISPKKGYGVEIEFVVDDERVHQAAGTLPDSGTDPLPVIPAAPVVRGLHVVELGIPSAPMQLASWPAAEGADHYYVESTTDGMNWRREGEPVGTSLAVSGIPAGQYLDIRVAAVGLLRGPWVQWHGTSGATVSAPGGLVDLALESPFTGSEAATKWSPAARASGYRCEVWQGGVKRREVTITATRFVYTVEDAMQDGGPWRAFEIRVTPVGVGVGETSSLSVSNPAIGQLNNIQLVSMAQGALWSCQPPSAEDVAGYVVYASKTNGFTPGPANLIYEGKSALRQLPLEPNKVWYIRCGAYDVWGKDGLQLSGQITVNTGAVQAEHISVASLSAIVANLGEIIAGRMHSADNAVDFDLDAKRLRVNDPMGQERVKLGLLSTGNYGLKVTSGDGAKSTVISANIGTIVAMGEAWMPTTLNADGTYGIEVTLDRAYDFADLIVLPTLVEDVAPQINEFHQSLVAGWGANWTPIYWKRVFQAVLAPGSTVKERDGVTASGRATYKTHTIADTGSDGHAIIAVRNFTRWDKGDATSGDKIYISAVKALSIAEGSGGIKHCIEIGWPLKVSYAVIVRNYQG